MTTKATVGSANSVRRKLALVIGISNYSNGTNVPNAINDAKKMSSALESIGFIIHGNGPQLNLTKMEMSRALADLKCSIKAGDMVLFYFAGHGKQWEDQNYLIPSNNFIDDDTTKIALSGLDLPLHAINAQHFLEDITVGNPFVTIFLLDCCRTYHLRNTDLITRDGDERENHSRGLKSMFANAGPMIKNPRPMIANGGWVIAFACAPGTIADDGKKGETNGLFTKHILKHIFKPNEDIRMMLTDVTDGVIEESKSTQIPYVTSSLRHRIICLYEQLPASLGTQPALDSRSVTPKNNGSSTYNNAPQSSMQKKEQQESQFTLLMQRMMMPIQSKDGRLMDEDGYFNDDGSRTFV